MVWAGADRRTKNQDIDIAEKTFAVEIERPIVFERKARVDSMRAYLFVALSYDFVG